MIDIEFEEKDEIATEKAPGMFIILCKQCRFHLTSSDRAMVVEGHHEHIQCNPQGYTFVFKCFSRVPGGILSGEATRNYSWFSGYSWQYAHCQGCGSHLGWYFHNHHDESFFGLIADKVAVVDQESDK